MSSISLGWGNRKERARLFSEVQRESTKDTCQRPKEPFLPKENAWPRKRDLEKPWDLCSCGSSQLYWTRPAAARCSWHSFKLHGWWWGKWWITDFQRSLVNEIILQYYLTASWIVSWFFQLSWLFQLCSFSWNILCKHVSIPELTGVVLGVLAESSLWRTNIGKRRKFVVWLLCPEAVALVTNTLASGHQVYF